MGVYTRPTSPYLWIKLPGRKGARFATKLRKEGGTAKQTTKNWQLAESIYNVAVGDVERERFDLPSEDEAEAMTTFAEHAPWYAEHHSRKHHPAELRKLARLRKHFDPYPLDQITKHRWMEYETLRTTGDGGGPVGPFKPGRKPRRGRAVARNTVGRELALMKAILETAVGEHLEVNPLASVARQTVKIKAKRTITRKDEAAFLKALKAIDEELHDMYIVGVGTLLRQETLVYLQRSEYRGDRLVVDTKTTPHQIALTGPTPLQRRAAKVLKRRLPKTADGFFFPRWHATFAPYEDAGHPGELLRKKVRRAAKVAGLPWGLSRGGITWHSATRASGATRLIREHQIDMRTVQLIGNWTSLDQMATYLGIDLELAGHRASA